jgi:hypothetical protein
LALSDLRELVGEHFSDPAVVLLSRALQEGLIGHVLDQRMLKDVDRLGRQPALVKQLCFH